jgi:hypothetical protein
MREFKNTSSNFYPTGGVMKSFATLFLLACLLVFTATSVFAQASSANYTFATGTAGTFTDMSTGTTQIVAADNDDVASAVTDIGFGFFLMGNRYTQFSATSNGIIALGGTAAGGTTYSVSGGTTTTPILSAFGSDLRTGISGKVHYKVTGSAPLRVLTIEFLNMSLTYVGTPGSNDGTYQVRLYENTGVIEFVYDGMYRNASTTGASIGIGWSAGSAANTFGCVTSATHTSSTSSFTTQTYTNSAVITDLNSPTNGSRRTYSYTPPTPTNPGGLMTFTSLGLTSMTLNWTDSPNEVVYALFKSIDGGVTYSFVSTLAQNTIISAQSGLYPATTYFWNLYAVSEGALSTGLSGSQATLAGLLTGLKSIPSGTYPTIKSAIDSLNLYGVGSGGVTFNVAAGYTEIFPTLASGIITATGAPLNQIVFQKSGGGANPKITAATPGVSTTVDGIISISGGDFITFNGIDLQENASNTTATMQMEWGYGLLNATVTDGPQYNVIKNCAITLNKLDSASTGIYLSCHTTASTTLLTVTTFQGTGSYNKFYSNTISNVYFGIKVLGYQGTAPYPGYGIGNEVGVDGGNTITNWGGRLVSVFAINGNCQTNFKIYNNNISGGTGLSTLRAIYVGTLSATGDMDIRNNTISLSSGAASSAFVGIELNSALGTAYVRKNTINGCTYPTATSGTFRPIYYNASGATALYIDSNTVSNNTLPGTGALECISVGTLTATTPLYIRGNIIYSNFKTGTVTTTGSFYAFRLGTAAVNLSGNQVLNNGNTNTTNTSSMYPGYYNGGSPVVENIYNNTFRGFFNSGTGTVYGAIYTSTSSSAVKNFYGNTIDSLYSAGGTIYGIYQALATTVNIYGNIIRNMRSSIAGAAVSGIYVASGTTAYVYNNFISDLKAPSATGANAINGIYIAGGTTAGVYYNTVYLNASGGATFGSSAIYKSSTTTGDLRNNIFVNISTPGSTSGLTVAHRWSGLYSATYYAATSNNNDFYAGSPVANKLIFYDGTNSDLTIVAYKARVSPRDALSVAENPPFKDVTATPYDLHMKTTVATQMESGATPVTTPITIASDYDGDPRNGSTPDMGADEFAGIPADLTPPTIAYTPFSHTPSTSNRTFTGIVVTDFSGVNVTAGTRPRLYYKKTTDANTFAGNTIADNGWKWAEATGTGGSPFSFTTNYSLLFTTGVVSPGDTIQYFVVAQDLFSTPNVAIGQGTFTATPASVALTSGAFPVTGTYSYIITQASLSGDYKVGTALFNRATGKNITFERRTRQVMREVLVPITDNGPAEGKKAEGKNNSGDVKNLDTPAYESQFRSEWQEVEEVYYVPILCMLSGSTILHSRPMCGMGCTQPSRQPWQI